MKRTPEIADTDLLLLLLHAPTGRSGTSRPLFSATRLVKLLYLLQQEGNLDPSVAKLKFFPHDFGPFSQQVYDAIELLRGYGLINVESRGIANYIDFIEEASLEDDISLEQTRSATAYREKVFSLTERGRKVAAVLKDAVGEQNWKAIITTKSKYAGLPLQELIAYVYKKYPESAVRSRLSHLR